MACRFCHREGVSQDGIDIDENVLLDAVGKMYDVGFRKFKLMGGEPMLYPNLCSVVEKMRMQIGNSDLSMISNGTAEPAQYEELLALGMNRLNISIHGWSLQGFVANTSSSVGAYRRIMRTVISLSEKRLISKLNYVVRKGINEAEFFSLLDFAGERGMIVDALNLLDLGNEGVPDSQRYTMLEIERLVRSRYGVREVCGVLNQHSLPSRLLRLSNGASVNLKVSQLNAQNVFAACSLCGLRKCCVEGIKAVRLTPSGLIQPCLLRRDNWFDIKSRCKKDDIAAYLRSL